MPILVAVPAICYTYVFDLTELMNYELRVNEMPQRWPYFGFGGVNSNVAAAVAGSAI